MSDSWSTYQQAIFNNIATGKGHTVVLARAGSGKTTTIVEGLKHVPTRYSRGVVMFAFNKKIADELADKVPAGVEVATTHSYGYRQCGRAFGKLRVNKHKVEQLIRAHYEKANTELPRWDVVNAVIKTVSLCKANLVGLSGDRAYPALHVPEEQAHEEIDAVMDQYSIETGMEPAMRPSFITLVALFLRQAKEDTSSVDFDDMIWLPVVHNLKVWQFDRVFVDETQDLNKAQLELVMRACKARSGNYPGGRILCVGDDRQAIYSFRGADKDAVNNVVTRLEAKVMKLTVCYRCATSIVALAARTVPDFEPSPTAVQGLVEAGVSEDTMRKKVGPGDFILSRANAPLIPLCWSFLREGRPAMIQGRDFATNLISMVTKAKSQTVKRGGKETPVATVEDFLDWLDVWQQLEIERLQRKKRSTADVIDKVDCLNAICDGEKTLDSVIAKCEALFGDNNDDSGKSRIILSSTHKAKGLERDKVFVLADTYRKRPEVEEDNLWYVAVTRARVELYLVVGVGASGKKWSVGSKQQVETKKTSKAKKKVTA